MAKKLKSKQIKKLTRAMTLIKVSLENHHKLRVESANKNIKMQDLTDQILEEHFNAEINT